MAKDEKEPLTQPPGDLDETREAAQEYVAGVVYETDGDGKLPDDEGADSENEGA